MSTFILEGQRELSRDQVPQEILAKAMNNRGIDITDKGKNGRKLFFDMTEFDRIPDDFNWGDILDEDNFPEDLDDIPDEVSDRIP